MTAQEGRREVHVLLVAFSAQGHINPMLRLGRRLVLKGFHVTLATTEIVRNRILKSSTTTTTTDGNTQINLEFFSDGLPLDYNRNKDIDFYMDCLGKFGPQNLTNLINHLSNGCTRPKFSCIINNPFLPWVADVASQFGVPCAMLCIQPCALYAIYYRFYNELNPFPTSTEPNMSVQLPGLPLLETQDLPSFVLPSNPFGSFPQLFSEVFRNMGKVKWVLGNSFYELEKDVVESMAGLHPIRTIGPLIPFELLGGGDKVVDVSVDMWKPDDRCINWLDSQPVSSVVYVSFGSIVVLSAKQMENIALGLKSSNQRFLWVVKSPEHNSAPGKSGELPNGFLEEVGGQGLVVQWCPQTKVLLHPAISCFITHCGWNSTLETVASGVPMICFPQWTDQPTNAKLIVDVFKMGVRLKPDEDGVVSIDEVKRCIVEVTSGPKSEELKKKAVEWKETARRVLIDGGSSDTNIKVFIDEVIRESHPEGAAPH